MASEAFALSVWFELLCNCCVCGDAIVVPSQRARVFREKGNSFYCSNGHSQRFRESDVEKLKRSLEVAKRDAEWQRSQREAAERSAAAYRGKVTAIKNRVGRGVCPCCNRTFQNLMKHMETKHPEFKENEK